MAHTITAVKGSDADLVKVKTALLSVSDKTGILDLGRELAAQGVALLSTGGTAKALRDAGIPCKDVSEHTGFPEILDGRVKSLHPRIHGGLLAVRGNDAHEADMSANGITAIDLVVCNLYAFAETVKKGGDFATCIENVDIGGPSMIRSAAKNNAAVTVAVSPSQYPALLDELRKNNGCTSMKLRRAFAAEAFSHTAAYDSQISAWFAKQVETETATTEKDASASSAIVVSRDYSLDLKLKYGCNPHQAPSWVGSIVGSRVPRPVGGGGAAAGPEASLVDTLPHSLPFSVLNGTPGYINLLDALNAYQLARELQVATGLAGAASFKHVSPAGAAVAVPLSETLASVYDIDGGAEAASKLTPSAIAYLRSRQADPMCSYGDFAALSEVVDEQTAMILKAEVSDGIIAPGYTPKALEILKSKKSGAFVVLEAKPDYKPPSIEYREVYGVVFAQRRNDAAITDESLKGQRIVTSAGAPSFPPEAVRDLLIALISIKYTQSNSVGYALDGQMIGVGAGQQSRVDCVKLAGKKVATWWLRQHPKVRSLPFKATTKRQARVNARVAFIEGDFSSEGERLAWLANFEEDKTASIEPLTSEEKSDWLKKLKGVSLASDAFFPFRDSIDWASRFGVSFVAQPGGSVQDEDVKKAAEEHGMIMAHNGLRLFHH